MEEILEREALKGLFFVLALPRKNIDFTVPPAVALLTKRSFATFADFFLKLRIIRRGSAELRWAARGRRAAPHFAS
jgi:hypothetical protein